MIIELDGLPVFVHTGGVAHQPDRPIVVFIHGAGMDHTVFRFQARALAHHGFSVVVPDLPGHGRSAGPGRLSIAEYALWTEQLLQQLGCDRVVLVGHSLGAFIALEVAANRPELVSGLVLLGPAIEMTVHPALQQAADANEHLAFELITGWSFGVEGHLGGHPQPGTRIVDGTLRLLERSKPGVLAGDLRACADYRPPIVQMPTLLIVGDRDRMTPPASAAKLASTLPSVRTVQLDGGHMLMSERPTEVRRLIEAFLASTIS